MTNSTKLFLESDQTGRIKSAKFNFKIEELVLKINKCLPGFFNRKLELLGL